MSTPADGGFGTTRAVAGVVLAAGEGRRMGQTKALTEVGGQPLVRHAVGVLASGGCWPIAVVVGAEAQRVAAEVPSSGTVVHNLVWRTGMRSSLRAGLRSLTQGSAAAAMIMLVDQPGITPQVVARLRRAWSDAPPGVAAVVATYDGLPRNPVVLARRIWGEVVIAATPDHGARVWLRANPHRVLEVECGDIGTGADLDTPEDLREWSGDQV